jgi:hypothetical protein
MAQQLYVAKPVKVLAEQYREGTTPDPMGVHRCGLSPLVETGPPHVHGPQGELWWLQDTDWIVASKWAPAIPTGVLTNAQFQEEFGAGPPLAEGG